MSMSHLVTLTAVLLVFVSIFGGIKGKSSGKELIAASIRVPLGGVGLLFIVFTGFYVGTLRPVGQHEYIHVGNKLKIDYPVEKVQVISPLEGDAIECRILTMGVYPDGEERDIWVVLKPADNRYYPQSDFTNVSYKRNGKWQVISRFGGDLGEKVALIVYTTDKAASQFFSSTIQEWKDALSYPGLNPQDIPASAKVATTVNVTLKDNCRGVF